MKEDKSPFEMKCCYDCGHLIGKVSWWCTNEEAINVRGTSIPGVDNCPYWKPDWKMIDEKYKIEENGYKQRKRRRMFWNKNKK